MKKQAQFGLLRLYGNPDADSAVRAQVEEPLNHGWNIHSWKIVGTGVDEANTQVVNIAILLTRELEDTPAAKVGRPAKVDA